MSAPGQDVYQIWSQSRFSVGIPRILPFKSYLYIVLDTVLLVPFILSRDVTVFDADNTLIVDLDRTCFTRNLDSDCDSRYVPVTSCLTWKKVSSRCQAVDQDAR